MMILAESESRCFHLLLPAPFCPPILKPHLKHKKAGARFIYRWRGSTPKTWKTSIKTNCSWVARERGYVYSFDSCDFQPRKSCISNRLTNLPSETDPHLRIYLVHGKVYGWKNSSREIGRMEALQRDKGRASKKMEFLWRYSRYRAGEKSGCQSPLIPFLSRIPILLSLAKLPLLPSYF